LSRSIEADQLARESSGDGSDFERLAMGLGFAGACRAPDCACDVSRFNDREAREGGSVTENSLRRWVPALRRKTPSMRERTRVRTLNSAATILVRGGCDTGAPSDAASAALYLLIQVSSECVKWLLLTSITVVPQPGGSILE